MSSVGISASSAEVSGRRRQVLRLWVMFGVSLPNGPNLGPGGFNSCFNHGTRMYQGKRRRFENEARAVWFFFFFYDRPRGQKAPCMQAVSQLEERSDLLRTARAFAGPPFSFPLQGT